MRSVHARAVRPLFSLCASAGGVPARVFLAVYRLSKQVKILAFAQHTASLRVRTQACVSPSWLFIDPLFK